MFTKSHVLFSNYHFMTKININDAQFLTLKAVHYNYYRFFFKTASMTWLTVDSWAQRWPLWLRWSRTQDFYTNSSNDEILSLDLYRSFTSVIHFSIAPFRNLQRFPGTRHTIIAIMYWFAGSVLLTLCSVARFQSVIAAHDQLGNYSLSSSVQFFSIERLVFQLLLWGSLVF